MDNCGELEEIISIPNFIQKYIELEVEHFNSVIVNDFCNDLCK